MIVPYGQLHSLPFHALFDGKQYMIDKFNVCYEPSASILAYSHRWQNPELKASLIIGVEDAEMPSIKQEIETVRKALPDAKVLWEQKQPRRLCASMARTAGSFTSPATDISARIAQCFPLFAWRTRI